MKYMVDMLREHGAGHIRVVGGGGGTITPEEIRELEAYGVERIYHPNDGMKLGPVEMIEDVVKRVSKARDTRAGGAGSESPAGAAKPALDAEIGSGRSMSAIEEGDFPERQLDMTRKQRQSTAAQPPVIGTTATDGAGQLSVTNK